MIVNYRILLLLLICSMNLPASYRPYAGRPAAFNIDAEMFGKVLVFAGIATLAGYGLYKVCDWLFSPSDECVLQDSMGLLQRMQKKYEQTVGCFEAAHGPIPESICTQKQLIKNINEGSLYEYAINYKRQTVFAYLNDLSSSLCSLKSASVLVNQRIAKLHAYQDKISLKHELQAVEREIARMIYALEFIQEYYLYHRSYYELFEVEASLLKRYASELNALYASQGNVAYLKEAVRSCAMQMSSAYAGYPFMHYIDRLRADCKNLGEALGNMSHCYTNRLQAAGSLLKNMQFIQSVVVCDDAYHQELRDYKREQLERERLEAERAKAAAAMAQASALQEQAWQMQRQNKLHAAQIKVTAEQNMLLATQAIVNAINPPQEVHVHL